MSESELVAEVRGLEALGLEDLRAIWRERVGPVPKLRSPDLLRQLLAWRLQAEAFGGLDLQTRRALGARSGQPSPRLPVGLRLSREWKGLAYQVEVLADGVSYRGRTYRSLSEVAREITGVRWNGPRFFGLRQEVGGGGGGLARGGGS